MTANSRVEQNDSTSDARDDSSIDSSSLALSSQQEELVKKISAMQKHRYLELQCATTRRTCATDISTTFIPKGVFNASMT